MKRNSFLAPLLLPQLSDRAAVQLVDIMEQLTDCVQHFYRPQIELWRRQNQNLDPPPHSPFAKLDDEPF